MLLYNDLGQIWHVATIQFLYIVPTRGTRTLWRSAGGLRFAAVSPGKRALQSGSARRDDAEPAILSSQQRRRGFRLVHDDAVWNRGNRRSW